MSVSKNLSSNENGNDIMDAIIPTPTGCGGNSYLKFLKLIGSFLKSKSKSKSTEVTKDIYDKLSP